MAHTSPTILPIHVHGELGHLYCMRVCVCPENVAIAIDFAFAQYL